MAEHSEIITEHAWLVAQSKGKQQSFLQRDIWTRKYQIPQVDDYQMLKNNQQEIQCKVEEYEDISRRIHDDTEKAKHIIQEMMSLNKEITDPKLNKQQCKLEVESRFEEIQLMGNELNDSMSANDMFELVDNTEDLLEDIEKWAEGFQCLKKTAYSWKRQNSCFEDTVKKLEDNMSLRDQKAADIEEQIMFLNLMIRVEEMMSDHKVKVTRCRSFNILRKQQEGSMQDHREIVDDRQQIFVIRYNCTKEEYYKAKVRKQPNINFENKNINCCVEDIEYEFRCVEELGGRVQEDIAEISDALHRLEVWNSEIQEKCKEEISYPENEYLRKEHMGELKDLCAKLDRWSEEYGRFEAEHYQWIKKKSELEEKMKKTEQIMDAREEQNVNIDESITCLNRMIDAEEKMKEHRKLMNELSDLEKQKKDIDSRRAKIVEKIQSEKEDNKLGDIKEDLRIIQNRQKKEYEWAYENDHRLNVRRWKFWNSLGNVIKNYMSDVQAFDSENIWEEEASKFEYELVGRSDLFYDQKHRIQSIEKTYIEVSQKHDKLTGPDCMHHMKEYLGKIESLFRDIDGCNQDARKTISDCETERDTFEKNLKAAEDKIKFVTKLENKVSSINFMFNPEKMMTEHRKRTANIQNQKNNAQKRWETHMSDHGHTFDSFSMISINQKHKLAEILNRNREYVYGPEKVQHSRDNDKQQHGKGAVSCPGDVEETKKNVDHTMEAISQMTETAVQVHQKIDEMIEKFEKDMYLLDDAIEKEYAEFRARSRCRIYDSNVFIENSRIFVHFHHLSFVTDVPREFG